MNESQLLVFAILLVLLILVVPILRRVYLRRVTLTPEDVREYQVDVTEAARRASIQPGMEIDLRPVLRGLREPDRRAVVHPLLDQHVFGWLVYPNNSTADDIIESIARALWSPTRSKVIVSQWVTDQTQGGVSTTTIIENVFGDFVGHDKADGDIVHGDHVGRDKVGRDKAGRDARSQRAGRDMPGSGNVGDTSISGPPIATVADLSAEIAELAKRARAQGLPREEVDALDWASAAAVGEVEIDPRDQARAQRVLNGSSTPWLRTAISGLIERATGTLVDHWILDLLHV